MKKLLFVLCLLIVLGCSSCQRRCHCYGYDGSHTFFTKEELSEMGYSCHGMQEYMYGVIYSLCEYDLKDY